MAHISDVVTVLLTGPSTNDPFLREARRVRSAAFVEIHTTCGVTGIGETYAGYFCPELVPHVVEFFKPILVGQKIDIEPDPKRWVDTLWHRMYRAENFWCRVGLGAVVLTGIEAALWDLAGKLLEQPVTRLLGGPKYDSLPCYASGGPSNYPKEKLAAKADHYLALGFRAFKLGAGKIENGQWSMGGDDAGSIAAFEADKVAWLRRHVGPDVKILLDGHMGNSPFGAWDLATARAVMKAVEPLGLFFFEEPLPYTDPGAYALLAPETSVPIAGGECLSTMPEWLEYIRRDSFDIGQPDASFVGGLSVFLEVAEAFHQRGRQIATHAWGAGGSLMQNIHAAFASPNVSILEVPPDFGELHRDVMGDSFAMKDGRVAAPQAPGLGIRLTDDLKRRFPFVPGSGEFISVPGKILVP